VKVAPVAIFYYSEIKIPSWKRSRDIPFHIVEEGKPYLLAHMVLSLPATAQQSNIGQRVIAPAIPAGFINARIVGGRSVSDFPF